MASNTSYDSTEPAGLTIPYAPNQGKLSEKPVLVAGSNTYVPWTGTLQKRLGSTVLGTSEALTVYPERLWVYETLEASPVVYVVGSFKNGSIYELRYKKVSSAGSWTSATNVRGSNHSVYPHEGTVRRGRLYIKGFPAAADDATKLGSVILDGTGGTMSVVIWGGLAPTVPMALSAPIMSISAATNAVAVEFTTASPHGYTTGMTLTLSGFTGSWVPANGSFVITVTSTTKFTIALNSTGYGGLTGTPIASWPPSAHSVTVRNSWIYTYTWEEASGNETNHAPLQTNPDLPPSSSGPFTDKIPTMTVANPASTTQFPTINIYRTTDGGGTYFFLYSIPSTGTATQVFLDAHLATGPTSAVHNDPLPDAQLDTAHAAPPTDTNSPPPTVAPPLVTGTDNIARCSRIVEYSARLWYAIGEYLFYSGLEELELATAVPEECFPSGDIVPNFFRMTSAVTNLLSTPSGLIIITRRDTFKIEGTSKATFNPRPFLNGIGGAFNQRRAATEAGSEVAWLTQDYRVAVVQGSAYAAITPPLGTEIQDAVAAGAEIDIKFWADGDKEWLVVAGVRTDNTALTKWWIYDLERSRSAQDDFWFTPWFVKTTAIAVGQTSTSSTNNRLILGLWDGTHFVIAALDPTESTFSDPDPSNLPSGVTGYGWSFTKALETVPAGDHVNVLRRPAFSPIFDHVEYDRTNYANDVDPTIAFYFDDFFLTPVTMDNPGDAPAHRQQSQGYTTLSHFGGRRTCKHVAVQFTGTSSTLGAEIQKIAMVWLPDENKALG